MWSEVNTKVEDGNLGKNSNSGTSAQVKIGVSNVSSSEPILITSVMKPEQIKEKLGCTPLADACIDATENGLKTIYAFPVKADVDGTVGELTHTGTGKGTVTIEGKPVNAFDVVIKISETGNSNEGSFTYSIDGGNSFSDDITIPLSKKFEVSEIGVTIVFADADEGEDSFIEDDIYSFETTAPTLNNQSALKAVEKLKTFSKKVELCHIVGPSTKALWAALAALATELNDVYKNPIIFLCEARAYRKEESLDEYIKAMKEARKGINSIYISVSATYGWYTRKDMRTQLINAAGIISGIIGQAKESLSIGSVENFPISSAKFLKVFPEALCEGYDKELDEIGYTVLRQYVGKDDFFIANGNVLAPSGSDFQYIESVRVLNRLVKEVCGAATDKLQCEIDPLNLTSSLAPIEAHLNIPVEDCISDGIISSGEATIDTENLNILADETLDVEVAWVPMGTARLFNIGFKVNNPAKTTD